MAKLISSLLFLIFSIGTIVGIQKYFENRIDDSKYLAAIEIDQIIKNNPTAAAPSINKNNSVLIVQENETKVDIDNDESFDFLKK